MKRLMLYALLALPATSFAQSQAPAFEDVSFPVDSRSGAALPSNPALGADGTAVLFRQTVKVDEAAWLQLRFAEAQLGSTGYVRITSLADGDSQQLDASQLAQWSNTSAYLNGDSVEVELHGAPAEAGLFFRLENVRAGEQGGLFEPATICDTRDDRDFSNDPRIGRAAPVGCTVWIIENGALLTAGHCVASGNLTSVEFNVPRSNDNGTKVRSATRDQYPVIAGTLQSRNSGIGEDWAVFAVGPNPTTGMTPIQAQRQAFRVSQSTNPGTIRITGFGTATGNRNQSQQTSTGAYSGQSQVNGTRVSHTYRVDTTGGNSGSPIIAGDGVSSIGIHTNGGCSANSGRNSGTSFNNPNVQNAIREVGAQIQQQQR